MKTLQTCKPKIDYPCRWQYRVIGCDPVAMRQALNECLPIDADAAINQGNSSSGGRYSSLNLDILVGSEEERLQLYQSLASHAAIRMIL